MSTSYHTDTSSSNESKTGLMSSIRVLWSGMATNIGSVLVATVFGATAWTVNHIVDSVISSPAIEYRINSDKRKKEVTATIQNLSRDHKFDDLKVIFLLPLGSSTSFTEAKPLSIRPPSYPGQNPVRLNNKSVSYTIQYLQPGGTIELTAVYKDNNAEARSLTSDPKFHIVSDNPVRAIERGPLTWLIRNEIPVLVFVCSFWGVAVVATLFVQNRSPHQRKAGDEG